MLHRPMTRCLPAVLCFSLCLGVAASAVAQRESVRPGINQNYKDPDVKQFVQRFESESREISARKDQIIEACEMRAGMSVADVGAGTGLLTRLIAEKVGAKGRVYAVDVVPEFVEHIQESCQEQGLKNVTGIVCQVDSVKLPPRSVDLVLICDTYHHFEFPYKTMKSVHRALRPGGRLILIDFKRIEGESSEWILSHVRAGQDVVTKEVVDAGFEVVGEKPILEQNYFLIFRKADAADGSKAP